MKGAVLGTGTPMVSSKVVQPTATVSSVPVSGPSKIFLHISIYNIHIRN